MLHISAVPLKKKTVREKSTMGPSFMPLFVRTSPTLRDRGVFFLEHGEEVPLSDKITSSAAAQQQLSSSTSSSGGGGSGGGGEGGVGGGSTASLFLHSCRSSTVAHQERRGCKKDGRHIITPPDV